MGAHARLSASGSKRWLNCPGSPWMEDAVPPKYRRDSGEAARLGTAAHGLAEVCLKNGLRTSRGLRNGAVELDQHEDARVFWPSVELRMKPGWYLIDDDMCDAVDVYLDVVWGIVDSVGCAELFVERRFDLRWLRPDMFGTGDAAVFQLFGRMYIVDYKHGQGVPVDVVNEWGEPNEQVLYYCLGLAHDMEWLFEDAELVIVQPRCPHQDGPVRRVVVTREQLEAFTGRLAAGYDAVQAAAADPKAHLSAGSWCGWCQAEPMCPARLAQVQEAASMDFRDEPHDLEPPNMETEEAKARLVRVLLWADQIDALLRSARAMAERAAKNGEHIDEHKLVRGKSNRVWLDESRVIEAVCEADPSIDHDLLLTPPKLKSPAQVEKLSKRVKALVNGLPNKEHDPTDPGSREWLVEPLAAKPPGKVTLAHVSDRRAAVEVAECDAASDFADDALEEED